MRLKQGDLVRIDGTSWKGVVIIKDGEVWLREHRKNDAIPNACKSPSKLIVLARTGDTVNAIGIGKCLICEHDTKLQALYHIFNPLKKTDFYYPDTDIVSCSMVLSEQTYPYMTYFK